MNSRYTSGQTVGILTTNGAVGTDPSGNMIYEIGKTFELDLANIIKGTAFHEISVENAKIKAAENPHFDVFTSWECIDIQKSGSVCRRDLITFLAKNGVACSELESLYFVNLISRGKNELHEIEFITWFLPYTSYNLKLLQLRRREGTLSHRRIHEVDCMVTREVSEKLAASIIGEELRFNSDIQNLKQQFLKDHSHSLHDISSHIVFSEQGHMDYKRLCEFMKRINIMFGEEEWRAFYQRSRSAESEIGSESNWVISYEELIEMIMPVAPEGYNAYRDTFNSEELHAYVVKKAKDFEVDVGPPSFGGKKPVPAKEEKNIRQHYQPFRHVYDPFLKGKLTFCREFGYMSQLDNYNLLYCNPSRDTSARLRNSSTNGGIRNHDSFYDRYYELLYNREQNEVYYNKLGKRYAIDTNGTSVSAPAQQTMIKKIRANKTYASASGSGSSAFQGKPETFDATQKFSGVTGGNAIGTTQKGMFDTFSNFNSQPTKDGFYKQQQGDASQIHSLQGEFNTMKQQNSNSKYSSNQKNKNNNFYLDNQQKY